MITYSYVITENGNGQALETFIGMTYSLSYDDVDDEYILNELDKYVFIENATAAAPWPNPICTHIF